VSDDYLWDRSGVPDAGIARLEELLRPLAHDGRPFAAPRRARPWGTPFAAWAAAAVVALAISAGWRAGRAPARSWEVARLSGAAEARGRLGVGEWIETGEASRARIRVGLIGDVVLEPRTKVRLVDAGLVSHRLSLSRGILHARIWAPPGRFLVDTPSATAVDLGCQYTLAVDDLGAGRLSVESGAVAFVFEGRESFVPAEASCRTRPSLGPGTPHFDDASDAFKAALDVLDFGELPARPAALATVLAEARPEDTFSLWHLLSRGGPDERALVYERMSELIPPPASVSREGLLAGDRESLDLYWNARGLEDVSRWRLWERPWAQVRHKQERVAPASPIIEDDADPGPPRAGGRREPARHARHRTFLRAGCQQPLLRRGRAGVRGHDQRGHVLPCEHLSEG
jgi:hypothetical protein